MKIRNIDHYKPWHLLLLILFIIAIVPPLLVLPALAKFWNFSESASIGETIGGITSPFISGLAAVLVFLAFKAQIQANQIITNQEKARNILTQIILIQDDKLKIDETILRLQNRVEYLGESIVFQVVNDVSKINFFTSEMRLAYELIKEYTGEKDFLYRKLYYLYVTRYQTILSDLSDGIKQINPIHGDYELPIADLLFQIKFLNDNLEDVNKYSINKTN